MQRDIFAADQTRGSDCDHSPRNQNSPQDRRHRSSAFQQTNAAMLGHTAEFHHYLTQGGLLRKVIG